ncbi:hypothetical protein CGCVW01_v009460 [Colletotrichum viniferum]|nr:hypothetical protein CGCVW01_v009460 [Colletotrichum viniferum]
MGVRLFRRYNSSILQGQVSRLASGPVSASTELLGRAGC